jgi:CheY-like chemotaxis protein
MSAPCSIAGRRLLIIEDNDDARTSLQWLFQLMGYQVDTAADGLEGVRKGLGWRPQVAIIDIGLPGCSGYEVARQLRARLDYHPLLIALTGYSMAEDVQKALAAGFDRHLSKPADMDRLLGMLAPSPQTTAETVPPTR